MSTRNSTASQRTATAIAGAVASILVVIGLGLSVATSESTAANRVDAPTQTTFVSNPVTTAGVGTTIPAGTEITRGGPNAATNTVTNPPAARLGDCPTDYSGIWAGGPTFGSNNLDNYEEMIGYPLSSVTEMSHKWEAADAVCYGKMIRKRLGPTERSPRFHRDGWRQLRVWRRQWVQPVICAQQRLYRRDMPSINGKRFTVDPGWHIEDQSRMCRRTHLQLLPDATRPSRELVEGHQFTTDLEACASGSPLECENDHREPRRKRPGVWTTCLRLHRGRRHPIPCPLRRRGSRRNEPA